MEKVYVAIGDDLQDGYKTLFWTLNKWNFISIVILHLNHHHISNGLVNSFYGKVPASVMSEEQLLAISLYEQQKTDKLLSKYLTFCAEGKVKAQVLKIDTKGDEPVHKLMIDLISRLRITTLVLATTFMKQSSWRSKSGISGSLKVHQDKPDFCKLYIIRGGKLLSRREENDNKGVIIMRQKTKLKRGLTKTIAQIVGNTHNPSASNMDSTEHEWENCVGELQTCFPLLMSLNLDGKKNDNLEISSNDNLEISSNDNLEISSTGSNVPEVVDFDRGNAENMERKIDEARQTIRSNQDEAKFHAERSQNAEFLISLCNRRVEEMESRTRDGIKIRIDLINKHFETEKEQEEETIKSDVKESRTRLNSLLHLQRELSNKLQLSTMAKSHAEAQLEKAVNAQAEMVRQIRELRRQNDILHRRIFCKEKDSTRMVSRQSEVSRGCRAYTAEEIKLATDGFSERHRVKSNGRWTNVYRGRIHQTAVAIKLFNSVSSLSPEAFQAQVERLNNIRHPHFVAMMGFCSEIKCIVYEYMHHGCLEDNLFSSRSNFCRTFRWHDRIRVAHEVCSGLTYFHLAEPRPIVHGNLTPSHILLDRNFVAKISGFGLDQCSNQSDLTSDVKSFGVMLLNLLYGRNWAGLMGKVTSTNGQTALVTALDEVLREWPLDLAEELSGIAVKCLSTEKNLRIEEVMKDLEVITKKANSLIAEGGLTQWPVIEVPDVFLCPIFQEVMKNPCIAADGFSYELKAIEEWLQMGNDNSPMTKLKLTHKQITPNLTLRSLIQDWHSKRSIPF
ncbi:hypothetical protein ACFE04_019067 [Oxalis oulophora]